MLSPFESSEFVSEGMEDIGEFGFIWIDSEGFDLDLWSEQSAGVAMLEGGP